MKIIITETQLKSIIEVSGKPKYPNLDLMSDDEVAQIASEHIKKYRTLKNNKALLNACIERGIDYDSFRPLTSAKKYRMMSDDELLKLARKYSNMGDLQQKAGVLYYELKKRDISKNLFKPFMRHINTEIPTDMFLKKKKDYTDLDDDRRYDSDSFMFSPVNEEIRKKN